MSWTETRTWWHHLLHAVNEANARQDGHLPWHPELSDVFGDRDGMLAALRYFWKLTVEAQVETEAELEELVARHQGLQIVLDQHVRPLVAA